MESAAEWWACRMEYDIDYYKHFGWLKKVRSVNFSTLLHWSLVLALVSGHWWRGIAVECARSCHILHRRDMHAYKCTNMSLVFDEDNNIDTQLLHGAWSYCHIQGASLFIHTRPGVKRRLSFKWLRWDDIRGTFETDSYDSFFRPTERIVRLFLFCTIVTMYCLSWLGEMDAVVRRLHFWEIWAHLVAL